MAPCPGPEASYTILPVTEHQARARAEQAAGQPPPPPPPSKIVAVHLTYRSRAMERGRLPRWPSYFLQPLSTLVASGEPVLRPPGCELLAFEGEVALVIRTRASRVSPDEAWRHVGWVTGSNDFGVYDLRYADSGASVRSKGIDGYTPFGPRLLPAAILDPDRIRLRTWVNGTIAQDAVRGQDLLFSFADIVADISRLTTLEPGDVILTGTPTGSTVVQPGDLVEVEVSAALVPGARPPAGPGGDEPDAGAEPGYLSAGRLRSPIAEAGYRLEPPGAMPAADDAERAAAYGAGGVPGADGAGRARGRPGRAAARGRRRQHRDPGVAAAPPRRQRAHPGRAPPTRPGQKMAGFARTLRYVPFREDLSADDGATAPGGGLSAQERAVEQIRPGEVLVIEAGGDHAAGTVGRILALRAQVRGAAGIVTDGAIRDSQPLHAMELPVYYGATHPAVPGRRHVPWEVNGVIACAGVTVTPGDVIAGDGDGVIVIPAALAAEVASDAAEQERQEEFAAAMVAAGESVDGLSPLGPRWRDAYQDWLRDRDKQAEQEAAAAEGDSR